MVIDIKSSMVKSGCDVVVVGMGEGGEREKT